MTQEAKLLAVSELADNYIEIILSTEPKLLVDKVADESGKRIAKSAQNLAEFRKQLIEALAQQDFPDLDSVEAPAQVSTAPQAVAANSAEGESDID